MNPKLILVTVLITVFSGCSEPDTVKPQAVKVESANTPLASRPASLARVKKTVTADEEIVASGRTSNTVSKTLQTDSKAEPRQRTFATTKQPAVPTPQALEIIRTATEPLDRESYQHFDNNPIKRVAEHPVSTFSIDVDTGSYSNVRRMLNQGRLPVRDAVRVEELVNYFDYNYPVPTNKTKPFSVTTEVGPNPWNKKTRLLHIGIQGYDVDHKDIPASNLVFLIDVSGSMRSADKLDLLKKGLLLLSKQMRAEDRISIVVYAGASGVVLEPTPGNETFKITHAIEQLTAAGSTNGAAGIQLAYQLAESVFIKDGVNRILLATDGDFNVGTTSFEQLMDLVETKRKSGIGLSTLGFGTGNYNDHLAEQLADRGNGSYAYIDTLNEANKVLVDQLSATLLTIAKDVKIQVEFNPAVVSEYRLVGYENRTLRREDFNNDKIDAGDIGAGHNVTAIYELTLAGKDGNRIDPLRYGEQEQATTAKDEIAYLKLRYKRPGEDNSRLTQTAINTSDIIGTLAATSERYRFSASVAGFAQLLRGGDYTGPFNYKDVIQLANGSRNNDPGGYRGEFIQMVKLAKTLDTQLSQEKKASSRQRTL